MRKRRGCRIRRDRRGVASTIGTIMALMVFLSFLAMFTNQWVPVYMTESEAKHVTEVMLSMSSFKTNVDFQILAYRIAQMTNYTTYVPPTLGQNFKLGASGIPVFAADTAGQLRLSTDVEEAEVSQFTFQNGGLTFNGRTSSGMLDMYMPNRYFIQERIIYENGAIIVEQSDGVYIRDGPQFAVMKGGSNVNLSVTFVHLYGTDRSVTGVGAGSVTSKLLWVESEVYRNINGMVNFTFESEYATAWYDYFEAYLRSDAVGDLDPTDFTLLLSPDEKEVTLSFNTVRNLDLSTARLNVAIGGFNE